MHLERAVRPDRFPLVGRGGGAQRKDVALEAVQQGKDLTQTGFYLCPVCGHIELGKAPDSCPICGAKKEKFVQV